MSAVDLATSASIGAAVTAAVAALRVVFVASRSYSRIEISVEMLCDRVGRLDARIADLDEKIRALEGRLNGRAAR